MLDFVSFILISGLSIFIVMITFPHKVDFLTVIIFLFILVPTIVALISGAPFVPTPMKACKKLLKAAKIKKGEKVVDIGCGDGRLCHLAAKEYGANTKGYELSPLVYAWAKIRQLLWRSKAKITFGDFRMYDLSDTDHIVTYMLPETLAKFIPKFEKELKKGTQIISYAFHIGDWKPIKVIPRSPEDKISKIWIYEIGRHK